MTGAAFAVIGHRGARGLFPENTLEGFVAAWDLGIRAFELDVGMTADGMVVVSHDPALSPDIVRDASGRWLTGPGPLIHELSAAALAQYDVGRIRPGSRNAVLFPQQRPGDGARIPTLAAVLAALPEARLIIEVKTDPLHAAWTASPDALADAVLVEIDRASASDRVVVESFDWRVQRHLRRVRPDLRLAFLTRSDAPADPWWGGVSPEDYGGSTPASVVSVGANDTIWAPAYADLTPNAVIEAHHLGLRVVPWTVNRTEDMRRLITWGVDGIISDFPDRLAVVAGEAASG